MAHATVHRAFEIKGTGLIGGELNNRRVAFLEYLIDVIACDLDSVVAIGGSDDQTDLLPFLYGNYGGVKIVVLSRYIELMEIRLGCLPG